MNKKTSKPLHTKRQKISKLKKILRIREPCSTKSWWTQLLTLNLTSTIGYSKYEQSSSDNSRNSVMRKTARTEDGRFERDTPRDLQGDFEPQQACYLTASLPIF